MIKGIDIIRSDEKETEVIINDSIKVTINAENFNEDGEMIVDYDETKITEGEAAETVNEYFTKLVDFLNKKKQEIADNGGLTEELLEETKND